MTGDDEKLRLTPEERDIRELYKIVDSLNEKHFADEDNHLVIVRNDCHKTYCVKFAGKCTDPDRFADGKKSMMFTAEYGDVKKLVESMKRTDRDKNYYEKFLVPYGRAHGKDAAEKNPPTEDISVFKEEDPLDWRPESRDTPIQEDALKARLSMLSAEDAETVREGKKVPGFMFHYMGGSDRLGLSGRSALGDELMTLYMCAAVAKDDGQALRIFKSSAAFKPWREEEVYAAAMMDARRDIEALRRYNAAGGAFKEKTEDVQSR